MSVAEHGGRFNHLVRRISVGFIVAIWIAAPYFLLQQFSLYDVIWLQETALDKWFPVSLNAVYIYFSYYILLVWAVFSVSDCVFVKYLQAICMVCLVSHLCFFFIPTGLSREEISLEDAPLLYEWLVSWEKPRNCLPSLHASLATLATLALWKNGRGTGLIALLWLLAVLWAAITLRQHLLIDLAAGVVLALGVWQWMVWKIRSK